MPDDDKTQDQSSAGSDNQNGNNGASAKTVPESDLIALKQSLESKVAEAGQKAQELETQLATAQSTLEQERAGHKPVEEKAQQVDQLTEELTKAKSELDTTSQAYNSLLSQTNESLGQRLIDDYHLPKEKVDALSLEEKRKFLETLPAPSRTNPNHYDLGGGGTGSDTSTLSSRGKIRAALQ